VRASSGEVIAEGLKHRFGHELERTTAGFQKRHPVISWLLVPVLAIGAVALLIVLTQ
jgi:hypothetical protein